MKKILATLMAIAMVLSLVTIPVMAESADTATSVAKPGSANNVQPADAATLDEALNVPGGTITFVTEGDYPWVISGDAAVSTNVNVASSTSTVSATVTAAAGDIVQFDYMSFGEGTSTVWDGLGFYVDGTMIIEWNRVEEIATYAYELTEGEHTLSWTYKKDSSLDKLGDYAWLDNVYVGAPVQPSAVVVEDVTVPAGRRAPVQYTVLPAEAFDKSVTFTIAEESIATVDANGVVTGVAEGTTTITVTTVNGISGIATVTVTEALPTANFLGYIAYDPSGNNGIWGTFVASWYSWFYTMHRFKLGRLQYEAVHFSGDTPVTVGGYTVKPGDTVYNMHIPSCGSLNRAARIESYKKAYEFYKKDLDGKPMVFRCHSWLLFPKNREILPETLNMVDFIGDFYIYDSEEYDVFHDKWRVFAKDFEKPNSELPEDTTQRRCFKKWLLDGKKTGAGAGIFIYDGEKFTK